MSKREKSINETTLANIKPVNAWVAATAPWLDRWPNEAGSKPTAAQITAAMALNKNHVMGLQVMFHAMQLRPEGATNGQIVVVAMAMGRTTAGTQNNYSQGLATKRDGTGLHWFTRTPNRGVYTMTFTELGVKALGAALTPFAPAKGSPTRKPAKRTSGPRKGNEGPLPVEVPSQPNVPPVSEPVPAQAA